MPPRIVTARSMGLQFRTSQLAPMGPETSVVGHYSGGARAKNRMEGIARAKQFHTMHQQPTSVPGGLGAAGIGYHYLIPDDGSIICCRSTFHKGAHVLNQNANRIGVNMPGTLTASIRDKPTRRQARAFNWLLHNAHTDAMPRMHRTDNDLSRVDLFGHNDLGSTSCPGLFKGMYLRGGDPWVEPSGNIDEQPDDGLVDLTREDEEMLDAVARGDAPGAEEDAAAAGVGPDDDEREARADTDDDLELLEVDDEFDEDLADVLEEIESEGRRTHA
jgi:hypothetical protein